MTRISIGVNAQNVGIGTTSPDQKLEIEGSEDQFVRIHTTLAGSSKSGFELLRSTEFSGTDWKIVNDGGTLRFYDGTDNFLTDGDLNMTMTTSGNLGIGIDPPESHLHVAGSTDQFLKVHRTTGGAGMAGLDLLRDVGNSGSDWRIVNDGGVLQFMDNIDNFATEGDLNMVMTQSGNVGIGTESPNSPLHVIGTEFVGETGDGFLQLGDPAGTHIRFDNNEILARNADNPSLLYLQYWSGNLSLCDDVTGRVGVGTSSPQAKLHVTDGTDVTLAGGGELVLGLTSGTNIAMDGNEIQARSNGVGSALFMQVDGGDLLLIPNETGQVGIGITSSATLPSSEYLLAVDGKIISEEVRVELSGSWPDYVFHTDYALTPLDQLEEKISSLGHLPGMPSASQVETDGILLGDMQRTMMEKIEELTLYVIDLQKQIEGLKKSHLHHKS